MRSNGWGATDRVILFSVQRSKLKRKDGDRIYRMNMIFRKREKDIVLIP